MKRIILTAGLALLMSLPGLHAYASDSNELNEEVKMGNVWSTGDGTLYFTCPVMKGEGVVGQEDGRSVIDGVTYYHCCPPCQAPFRKDPQKWLAELFLPANVLEVDAAGQKHFVDPVNGEHGHLTKATPVLDLDGQRWYFVNAKTQKTFRKAPDKYRAGA